jgi:hypothetical protein
MALSFGGATRAHDGVLYIFNYGNKIQAQHLHGISHVLMDGSDEIALVAEKPQAAESEVASRGRWKREMFALPGLDAGFSIGAQHVVARSQGLALPTAMIKVQDAAGLDGESRVARERNLRWKMPIRVRSSVTSLTAPIC